MTKRSRRLAFGLAIGATGAGAGAYVAFVLAGGPWAAVGAVIGAVTGSFAPAVPDAMVGRDDKQAALRATAERLAPQSPARLLDPRRELVEFVGREDELKKLQAWCTDKEAGRLRLVTGPGGVGKTRLSVELADRMRKAGWWTERVADGEEFLRRGRADSRAAAALRS